MIYKGYSQEAGPSRAATQNKNQNQVVQQKVQQGGQNENIGQGGQNENLQQGGQTPKEKGNSDKDTGVSPIQVSLCF